MIDQRRAGKGDLTDDLRPHMQRRQRVLPRGQPKFGQIGTCHLFHGKNQITDQPMRTEVIDIDPPSKPSTGKLTASAFRFAPSTYSSGR